MKRVLKYLIALVVIALAFFAVAWFYSTREVETYTSPLTPVEVMKPEVRNIRESWRLLAWTARIRKQNGRLP